MEETGHPIPNLPALRAQLSAGLALELVDALTQVTTMAEASQILRNRLQTRTSEIEEGLDATSEVG